MAVVLDIGCGGRFSSFCPALARAKPRNVYFMGEPYFRKRSPDKIKSIIKRSDNKRFKIRSTHLVGAEYGELRFPDESIDLLTCNFPNLFMTALTRGFDNFDNEIHRTIKPGGLFYFSAAKNIELNLPDSFKEVGRRSLRVYSLLEALFPGKCDFSESTFPYEINPEIPLKFPQTNFCVQTNVAILTETSIPAYRGEELNPTARLYQKIR